MADDTLIQDLIAAGTPPALVQRVALEMARASIERENLEKRREQDRDRQSRRRRLSRDVTEDHGSTVTPRDITGGSPLPPSPPDPPNPYPTPGSDPDGSAEAVASPPSGRPELSVSDRVWTEFPDVLADLSGRKPQSVRGWLGKALAKYDADEVFRACSAAVEAGTGDPFGYAMRIMNPPKANGARASPRRNGNADFWANQAHEGNAELNGGRHDTGPFVTDPLDDWHRPGDDPRGGSDRTASQRAGADPRQLPPLRLVGRA